MIKIGIFIDHDIIIRHFVRNKALESLEERYDVHYIFPKNLPNRVSTDVHSLNLCKTHLLNVDKSRISALRKLGRLQNFRNIRNHSGEDKKAMRFYYRNAIYRRFSEYVFALLKTNILIFKLYVEFKFRRLGPNKELFQLLEQLTLDVIVHPTVLEGVFVNDLLDAGQKLKIPTIYLMNSWDNPSTKALMFGTPSLLLVWGRQTKEHAVKYLGCQEDKVVISGAAQFECYKRAPIRSKQQFVQSLSVKSGKQLICYAGSSKGLNEMMHLSVLDKALAGNDCNCHVIYRPHPWKANHQDERHFDQYDFTHISIDPGSQAYYDSTYEGDYFRTELMSYEDTHTLLNSIDGLISPLSTILLEASLFGIPVAVYLSDDNLDLPHFNVAKRRVQFEEFYDIINPYQCHKVDELYPALCELLRQANDRAHCNEIRQSCSYFAELSGSPYSEILMNHIDEMTNDMGIVGVKRA